MPVGAEESILEREAREASRERDESDGDPVGFQRCLLRLLRGSEMCEPFLNRAISE